MKKAVVVTALISGFIAGCGGGGGSGPDSNNPGGNQNTGGLKVTSASIVPQGGSVYVGQNISISAQWTSDRTLTQTKVKLCLARKSLYACGSNPQIQVLFTCDTSTSPCQGSFNINCTYKSSSTGPGYNAIECTLPDGSTYGPMDVLKSILPQEFCVLLYLEATDSFGKTLYDQYDTPDQCITLQP